MPEKKKKAKEKISLLISFLDEENDEILQNIEHELLSLNKQENTILKQLLGDIENPEILNKVNNIVALNNFKFSETELFHWLSSSEKNLYELLTIIAEIEYPDLNGASLKLHYDKMLRDIWASIPAESSSLDVAKLLKFYLITTQKFKLAPPDSVSVKHIMINDVLNTRETNKIFLNIFFLGIARGLGIPITPLMIDGLLIMAFENKKPYTISFIDNKYLFFIDSTTLSPYPEAKLREKFSIKEEEELPVSPFSDVEIVLTLLNYLGSFYLQNKKELISDKIKSLIELIAGN